MKSPDIAQRLLRFCMPPCLTYDACVISFGIGIAIYFFLPTEPPLLILGIGIAILGPLLWLTRHTDRPVWIWAFLLSIIFLGIGRSVWHTHAVNTLTLPHYERGYEIEGWVKHIANSGKGVRWHIVINGFDDLPMNESPKIVRVRLGQKYKDSATVGDSVSLKAILSAPPGPAVPNGYNPAQRAFFEKIGGFGFAISAPDVFPLDKSEDVSLKRRWAAFRYGLAAHIVNVSPPETAGLQAALLTGVRRYIPPEQTEALRAAGLAHILAISGLHMGLLAGTAFYVFTLLLVMIAPLSCRYDVRKPAAVLAIIAATAYLFLSGASVATQRAYIMAVIVFCAVILDRRALSVRSVSVAAFITLMLHPEALVSVGFQMSFAAVLALVVVYRIWQDHKPYVNRKGFLASLRNNAVSLSVTSLVAGWATAGFALFHFGRIAKYGLAGNLLAMPIFTFAVMPLGIIALLLMPLGLEAWPLWLMGQAVSQLVSISEWIASWEGAMWQTRAAPYWVIGLYGFAFILLLLGDLRGRILAGVMITFCAIAWVLHPVPDIRISAEGRVAFWETSEFQRLIVTSERADNYGRNQFSEKAGQANPDIVAITKTTAPCDSLACRFDVKGQRVSVLNHPSEARIECETSDVVILTQRDVGPEVRRNCHAHLIDGRVLYNQGAIEIYLTKKGKVKQIGTKKPTSKRRPWDY